MTHGRHCSCSACAREDWARPGLASCGIHGAVCPPVYAPEPGENPAYGPGNPDWERDFDKTRESA